VGVVKYYFPKPAPRTFAGDVTEVVNVIRTKLSVVLPQVAPTIPRDYVQEVRQQLPSWKTVALGVAVGSGLAALGHYGYRKTVSRQRALEETKVWLQERNQDDNVVMVQEAHRGVWADEVSAVACSKEVVAAVNLHSFGKERTVEGLHDLYRVLSADWKEKGYSPELQLARKEMATVAYWCVPESEIALMRYGTTGNVRQASERYRALRDSAPHMRK
jgi:hypothetical protein